MQNYRVRVVIITFLLLSIVLLSHNKSVWASPDQSPNRQTVPTRVRTSTPTEVPTQAPPTDTPTIVPTSLPPTDTSPAGPKPQLPTNTATPDSTTAAFSTPTHTIIPTQSPTPTATASILAPTVTITRSGITATMVASMVTSILPKVVSTPNSSPEVAGRTTNVSTAGIITGIFIMAILGVLVFVLLGEDARARFEAVWFMEQVHRRLQFVDPCLDAPQIQMYPRNC